MSKWTFASLDLFHPEMFKIARARPISSTHRGNFRNTIAGGTRNDTVLDMGEVPRSY